VIEGLSILPRERDGASCGWNENGRVPPQAECLGDWFGLLPNKAGASWATLQAVS